MRFCFVLQEIVQRLATLAQTLPRRAGKRKRRCHLHDISTKLIERRTIIKAECVHLPCYS